jgi:hypothetical protein
MMFYHVEVFLEGIENADCSTCEQVSGVCKDQAEAVNIGWYFLGMYRAKAAQVFVSETTDRQIWINGRMAAELTP